MRHHRQPVFTVAVRILPAALFAIIVTLSVVLGHAGHAQAPIVQPPLATGTPSATLTPQECNSLWNVVPSPNVGAGDNFLTSIDVFSSNDAWAVGYYTGTGRYLSLTEHWDGVQWSVVSSPNPGTYNNVLRGVTVIASNDAWAVGDYNNDPAHPTRHLLTMHWDGTLWNVVPNPDPGGNYDNSINAARAFSSSYVWAVGFYRYTGFEDLRMLWSGAWSVSYTPTVPYGDLYGIDGQTPDDAWAVGSSPGQSGYQQPLTEHLAGGNWSVVPGPSLPNHDTVLYGVGMVSTNDVWAVGASDVYAGPHSFIQHWDGTAWNIVTGPDVGKLSGVKALAANDVWAVGRGVFLHWDGTTWSAVTDPVGALLAGIDGLSTGDIWAVGTRNVGGAIRTLVEHYTPTCATTTPTVSPTPTLSPTPTQCIHTWTVVPSPNVGTGDNILNAVSVLSPGDVWAVGYYTGTGRYLSLTEHWDGAQWTIIPSPNPGTYNNLLRSVTAIASNDVWAVGDYNNDPYYSTRHLLTLHWDGTQWNVVPNPDPGGNYTNYLNGVKGFASNDVWTVGFYREYSPEELIMHWDGVQWTQEYTPTTNLGQLVAVGGRVANDVWAVGWTGSPSPDHGLIEHWDGSSWSVAPDTLYGISNYLEAVTASSSDDVWAVGYYISNNAPHSLTERWNGSFWSVYSEPNVGALWGVKALSANDVWAVGGSSFLHWDGSNWTTLPEPTTGTLTGVDASSPDDMWAVGTQVVGGVTRTLIERYLSDCSTTTPVPTATVTGTPTATVSRPPGTDTATAPAGTPTATGTRLSSTETATPPPGTTTATTPTPQATATSCTITFSDVPQGSTFYAYVRCLACHGIVQGYSNGTYRPYNPVTRGQSSKIVSNSAGWSDIIPPQQQTFHDVPPGSTFWLYIERAYLHGAISGYPCGGTGEPCPGLYFRPANTLTRGQTAKVVSNSAGWSDTIPPGRQTFSDVPPGSTFWLYIERAYLHGVISGYPDGTYRPQNQVTRGQIAKIAAGAFFPECDIPRR